MKNRKKFSLVLVITAVIIISAPFQVLADTVISIQPLLSTPGVGSFFDIFVNIDLVNDLYAFQFDISFDPNVISAMSVTEGAFLPGGGSTFFIPGSIDNIAGSISFTADTLLSAISGASGSGILANLQFQALAVGTTPISLSNVVLLDSGLLDISFIGNAGTVSPTGTVNPIPEPSTLLLISSGLIGLVGVRRKLKT